MMTTDRFLILALALTILGCSPDSVPVSMDIIGPFADLTPEIPDVTSVEIGAELPDLHVPDFAEEVDTTAEEGGFLWPCGTNDDCLSGFCVETLSGFVCTTVCVEDCPPDWSCQNIGTGPDMTYVCLPRFASLCRPCLSDDECGHGPGSGWCVDYAGTGTFCAEECANDQTCPDGYQCQETTLPDGTDKPLCIRTEGECGCPKKYSGQSLTTSCYETNDIGTCFGHRTCFENELTVCDALVPAPETCNGIDDDCNGETDEETGGGSCQISNEFGICPGLEECTDGQTTCNGPTPAQEQCDGLDNNCNGEIDEVFGDIDVDGIADCLDPDMDGDGIENPADNCPEVANPDQQNHDLDTLGDACDPDDDNDLSADEDDCEPLDPEIFPGAIEICDGIDNDCDGIADDGWSDTDSDEIMDCVDEDDDNDTILDSDDNCPLTPNPQQKDSDNDGLGNTCDSDKDGDLDPDATDCAPLDPAIGHTLPEVCDGLDNNCSGVIDDPFSDLDSDGLADCVDDDDDNDGVTDDQDNCPVTPNPSQTDTDNDGFGDACEDDSDGDLDPDATDCAPQNPDIHHGALEDCNAIDDNCNGIVDEGYPDADGDGSPNCLDDDDDNDTVPDVDDNCPLTANGDQADTDDDKMGNACDGDDDNDGFPDTIDCAPLNPQIHPEAEETCDGIDNNCDSSINPAGSGGCETWYFNSDNDNYGQEALSKCLCEPLAPYTAAMTGDCDDSNSNIYPGANEWCNSKDDDCDGQVDEIGALGCNDLYPDLDHDGFGAGETACLCGQPNGYAATPGDCDDDDINVKPGALELCDGLDNNCDDIVDGEGSSGCKTYYLDMDADGYGVLGAGKCLCDPQGDFTAVTTGDCDDDNANTYPSALEICNATDDNCNGQVDEGVKQTFYKDNDGDSFGTPNDKLEACAAPPGYVATGTDCNDFNATISPGADEICNEIDDNCDGIPDNGLQEVTVYIDLDGDGFGAENTPGISSCLYDNNADGVADTPPDGYSLSADDCNDSSAVVYPGAEELCDGILNDCNLDVADAHCPDLCPGAWPVYAGVTHGYVIPAQLNSTNPLETLVQGAGHVMIIDYTGEVLWDFDAQLQYSHPAIANMDADGYMEVILAETNLLRIIKPATMSVLEEHSILGTGWRPPVVFDLDNDGITDVVTPSSGKLTILLRDGIGGAKVKHTISPPAGSYFHADVPSIHDLDGDGIAEVIIATGYSTCGSPNIPPCKGYILVIDPVSGDLIYDPVTTFPIPDSDNAYTGGPRPFLADLDNDGENELFHYVGYADTPNTGLSWDLDGSLMDPMPLLNTSNPIMAPLGVNGLVNKSGQLKYTGGAAVDMDGDGVYEIVRNSAQGLTVSQAGVPMDGYPINNPGSTPVLADIDRNGKLDILFVGSDNASVNCYQMGEGTYDESRILSYGLMEPLSGGRYLTGNYDPYEPNDIRNSTFAPEDSVTPIADSRAFPMRGFLDKYASSNGWSRSLIGMLSTLGDRDYYYASGKQIKVTLDLLVGPADYDLFLHIYVPDGNQWEYLTTWSGETVGDDGISCHHTTPCPDNAHAQATKLFIIEVRGKDDSTDFGPWPYKLKIHWGAG